MSWDSKVLWTEGLFLQPHHFQQADRYTEALVGGLARRVAPYAWGVSQLEIDDEALKVGQFALRSAAGLSEDGATFRIPQSEDHPAALEIPETVKDCVIHLTVPARRQGAMAIDLNDNDGAATRYKASQLDITDTMGTERKAVPISVGKMRMRCWLGVVSGCHTTSARAV